jgi:hypothetical protein
MAHLNMKKNRFERYLKKPSLPNTNHLHHQNNLSGVSATLVNLAQPAPVESGNKDGKDGSLASEPDGSQLRWSSQDERDLADAVEKCKIGMSFYRIK